MALLSIVMQNLGNLGYITRERHCNEYTAVRVMLRGQQVFAAIWSRISWDDDLPRLTLVFDRGAGYVGRYLGSFSFTASLRVPGLRYRVGLWPRATRRVWLPLCVTRNGNYV